MKAKDFISITPTTNSGYIIEVPTNYYINSGTYAYNDPQELLKKVARVLNECHPNDRQISALSLSYEKEGDDDEM